MIDKERNQRLSTSQKNANGKQWYKTQIDTLIGSNSNFDSSDGVSDYRRMKVNYDLFNNQLDMKEFSYVCDPYGLEMGELPAKMRNIDISSIKIKALLGMEKERGFPWKVIAVNPEATTEKEQEEFGRLREFVVEQVMQPIKQSEEQKYQEAVKGGNLSEDEINGLKKQMQQNIQSQTPDKVRKYMQRDYQNPAEVMSTQLLNYLTEKCNLNAKFMESFKHGLISARSIMYVGVLNGEPEVWNVNPLDFSYEKTNETNFIEDGEWALCGFNMSPSQVVKYFGGELTDFQIDSLYSSTGGENENQRDKMYYTEVNENTVDSYDDQDNEQNVVHLTHVTWKSMRKLGFLTYIDEIGEEQSTIVDEAYKINKDAGDKEIDWVWIPEACEGWKIDAGDPIYVNLRPIPGQFKDLDDLYHCKLPYYGVIYDNLNSKEVSMMDRLVPSQNMHNIYNYKLELAVAQDKGKKVLMDVKNIPGSDAFSTDQWKHYFESTNFMLFNQSVEGNETDANSVAKVIDLTGSQQIALYTDLCEQIRINAGRSIGVTEAVEGRIGTNESVRNAQQNLTQTSYTLELYFVTHGQHKKNVLTALLETAKVAYAGSKPKKLSYVLDDMSNHLLDLDIGVLENSTMGVFISESIKAEQVKDIIKQNAQAAVQNDNIELSDLAKVLSQSSLTEIMETLTVAEQKKEAKDQEAASQQSKQAQELEEKRQAFLEKQHKFQVELIKVKGAEDRKTAVVSNSIQAAGFNPDLDKDGDGENDFLGLAKHGLNVDITTKKQDLDEKKFEYQKEVDEKKLKLEEKKINKASVKK